MMGETNQFEILCCPSCRGDLRQESIDKLFCPKCRYTFPIVDGIPVLFPCDVAERMSEKFGRFWDSEERAHLYDTEIEEADEKYGVRTMEAELEGITRLYSPGNLEVVLDAGCGNGRFLETLPDGTIKVGLDASLELLRRAARRNRGDLLVCGELEHLPFKDETFSTVISCRVLQHLREQQTAIAEMARVVRNQGDVILELYNSWNLKNIYKNIRMAPRLAATLNAPFRWAFHSMSPFAPWPLEYDQYNSWLQVKRWMRKHNLNVSCGHGVGWPIQKYLLNPFYVHAFLQKHAPGILRTYQDASFAAERAMGRWFPFRYTMEKFAIKATKEGARRGLTTRVLNRIEFQYKTSALHNSKAVRERRREERGEPVIENKHDFHLRQAIEWLKRAQDATPDDGVSRGYSVGWTAANRSIGWQPSYPETTGYIIPTLFDCSAHLGDSDLKNRAVRMADWEIDVQMSCGAVQGGNIDARPTRAVFNTGQVMLGWMRAEDETGDRKYRDAAEAAARFLASTQDDAGTWRRANSRFANPTITTYNSRVGWALIEYGKKTGNQAYVDAGLHNIRYTVSQQRDNGWFENNCLTDASQPLLHTICYAMEGLLGTFDELGITEYLTSVRLAADHLVSKISPEGSIAGRFNENWDATVSWNCLTGNAQLAAILLRLFAITGHNPYRQGSTKLLSFIKRTQNCATSETGLRGGIKGSYPFDGEYGKFEVLSWPTKFFIDALLMDLQLDTVRPSCVPSSGVV